jgi:hypothetical protein
MWSAGAGDDQARFLADLRALRDLAAIGYDELSARAHYPSDVLKEAENGPLLPGLPVLTAYVRACEGDVLDWEERWRCLAEVPADPDLPVRPAGASPAAAAGARAGVSVVPPDVYDPERIRAALRGSRGRTENGGGRISDRAISAPTRDYEFSDHSPAGWGAGTSGLDTGANLDTGKGPEAGSGWNSSPSWDAEDDQTITMANGNHSASHQGRGPFDAAIVEAPDPAGRTEQDDQFRWLPDGTPEPWAADDDLTWSGQPGTGQAAAPPEVDARPAEPAIGEWAPPPRDDASKPPERTDFWATSATATSADLKPPTDPQDWAEEPAPAEIAATSSAPATSELGQRLATAAAPSGVSATAPPQVSAEPARFASAAGSGAAQPASPTPADHGKDRFFPARLLIIIVIAALIGSALVLLLK